MLVTIDRKSIEWWVDVGHDRQVDVGHDRQVDVGHDRQVDVGHDRQKKA